MAPDCSACNDRYACHEAMFTHRRLLCQACLDAWLIVERVNRGAEPLIDHEDLKRELKASTP